jgi:hypothetical protein
MRQPDPHAKEPEFMRLQRAFTHYLRDPENVSLPGDFEDRRLAIYRHAIFANVAGLMADNYPRVRAIMDDVAWDAMLRDYIVRHSSSASAFIDVPLEFLSYLEHERDPSADPQFLRELAHFDWLETLVGADQRQLEVELAGVDRAGDLLGDIPVANPVMHLITYRFPVHAINAEYQPAQPPPRATRIAAYRDADNLYRFLDLNEASSKLLELVIEGNMLTGRTIIERLADEINPSNRTILIAAGSSMLERMHERGAVMGTRQS